MSVVEKHVIREKLIYVIAWFVVLLVPILTYGSRSDTAISTSNILGSWLRIFPFLFVFLIHNFFVAPILVIHKQYLKYMVLSLSLTVGVFFIVALLEAGSFDLQLLLNRPIGRIKYTHFSIFWNIIIVSMVSGINLGVRFIYHTMYNEEELERLKRENMQAEMEYLKYQINPHFFMNTLNNIHSLMDIDIEAAKNSVIELSKMMRYVIYDSGSESISLNQDVAFLKNYIQLMRIRYVNTVKIRINIQENIPHTVAIPPLLLVVFVENAFKHGVNNDKESFIYIDISYDDDYVNCRVENSVTEIAPAGTVSGIGLANVHKRLELIFGSKYKLHIDDKRHDRYIVELKIPHLNA